MHAFELERKRTLEIQWKRTLQWLNLATGFYVYGVFVRKEKKERLSEVAIVGAGGVLQHLFLFCSPVGSTGLLEQVQRAWPELTAQPELMSLTNLNQSGKATDLH